MERSSKRNKNSARLVLMLALAAVFVVSAVNVARDLLEYRKGAEVYAEAEEIANVAGLAALADERPPETEKPVRPRPEPAAPEGAAPERGVSEEDTPEESAPEPQQPAPDPYESLLREANLAALQEINSDVKGWIVLPGTGVSYPVLQGSDNDFYLSHDWKKDRYSVGSIFLDCDSSASFTDFNTLIYGHRMKDRSMFGRLKRYAKQDYLDAHPDLYVRTAEGVFRYAIYAAYEADVASLAFRGALADEEARAEFIRLGLESSVVTAGVTPRTTDRFLTLITCTGNGYESRWIVQAVLTEAAG